MATKTATYSTILPDDIAGFDPYQQQQNHGPRNRGNVMNERQQNLGYQGPAPSARTGRVSDVPNDTSNQQDGKEPLKQTGQKDAGLSQEKDQLSKHINNNKTLAFGLLFVVALLLVVIGYQAFHQRKLNAEAAKLQQNPATSGDDPPNQPAGQQKGSGAPQQPQQPQQQPQPQPQPQQQPQQPQKPQQQQRQQPSQSNQSAVRNDRILRQTQQKTAASPAPRGQSAMSRRQGCTDADDQRRLATIIEESETQSGNDMVHEQTRAIIAEQLRRDAENDDDNALGTGSVDVIDADASARRDLRRSELADEPVEERDEALIEQPADVAIDIDDEPEPATSTAQVVVLCPHILSHGKRAGQECQRECRPGKTKCGSHLNLLAKKANQAAP